MRSSAATSRSTASSRAMPGAPVTATSAIDFDPSRRALRHARLDLPRLYEDDDILIIDKPAGLLTIPSAPGSQDV